MNIPDDIAVWVLYWDNGWRYGRLLDIGEHRARVLHPVTGQATVQIPDLWTIQKEIEKMAGKKKQEEVKNEAAPKKAGKKALSGQTVKKTLGEKQAARRAKGDSDRYAGKKIKVLKKEHGAREGSARAKWLNEIIKSKTTDEALERMTRAHSKGAGTSVLKFAEDAGIIQIIG